MGIDPGSQLIAVVALFSVLAYLSLGLRCYARVNYEVWGLDDTCMLVSAVPLAAFIACDIMLALSDAGKPQDECTGDCAREAIKWTFISQIFWYWCMILIKSSIAFTLCRVTLCSRAVFSLYATVAISTIPLLMGFISSLAYCQPVSFLWDQSDPNGHCGNAKFTDVITTVQYTLGICNAVTGWFYVILLFPLLWRVQLRFRMKSAIAFLVALGTTASIISIIRILYTILYPTNSTYIRLAIWSYAEPVLGLLAANLSTIRPLIPYLRDPTRSFSPSNENLTGGAWGSTKRSTYDRQRATYELEGGALRIGITETHIRRSSRATELQLGSEKGGGALERGISVTRRFEVS